MAITYNNISSAVWHSASGDLAMYANFSSQAGDIFIAVIASDDNVAFTLPASWTLISQTNNGAGQRMTLAWFRATGDHEFDTFTFTRAGGSTAAGKIVSYRGCLAAGDVINASSVKANISSTTVDADAVAPSAANCMILFASVTLGGSTFGHSGTNPVFTSRMDNWWGNNTFTLADGIRTTADSTGARTATSSIAGLSIGSLIALTPDVPVPPTAPTLLTASCSLPTPPVAQFTADAFQGNAPLTIMFTDATSGSPTSWAWRLGDGTTSTSQNPVHVYDTPGIYDVELTATNALGSNTITKPVIILDPNSTDFDADPPVAMFSADASLVLPGATVTFSDQSTGDIASWAWTFGDGATSAVQNPTNVYAAIGQYLVTLVVTDSKGLQSSTTQVVVVSSDVDPADNPPIATIDPDYDTINAPETVNFVAHESTPNIFYLWDFGDGATSAEAAPSHEYLVEGVYTVTLTVRNIYGESTSSIQIVVRGFLALGVSNTKYYVLDKSGHRVMVYGPTGAFVKSFGSRGSTAGKLENPTQLLVSRAFMEVT